MTDDRPQASKIEKLLFDDLRQDPEMTLVEFHKRHGILYVSETEDQSYD